MNTDCFKTKKCEAFLQFVFLHLRIRILFTAYGIWNLGCCRDPTTIALARTTQDNPKLTHASPKVGGDELIAAVGDDDETLIFAVVVSTFGYFQDITIFCGNLHTYASKVFGIAVCQICRSIL